MTRKGHLAREADAARAAQRRRPILTAFLLAVSLPCASPDLAEASKEKFTRNKPHVNVGTLGMMNEVLTVRLELVDTVARATGSPTRVPCSGVVDLRVEDAATGSVLASRADVDLVPGTVETLNHTVAGPPATVRVVIVADDMRVDGKTCALRGQIEIANLADGRICRSFPVRREDFVAVTKLR